VDTQMAVSIVAGSDAKKTKRTTPKDARRQTDRKTHDTNKTKR